MSTGTMYSSTTTVPDTLSLNIVPHRGESPDYIIIYTPDI